MMVSAADVTPTVSADGTVRFADAAALAQAFPKLLHVTLVARGEAAHTGATANYRLVVPGVVDLPVQGKALAVASGKSVLYFPSVPAQVHSPDTAPAPRAPVVATPQPRPAEPPPLELDADGQVLFASHSDLEVLGPSLVKDQGMIVRPLGRRPTALESIEVKLGIKGAAARFSVQADLVPYGSGNAALIIKDPRGLRQALDKLRAGVAAPARPSVPPEVDESGLITFASPEAFTAYASSIIANRGIMGQWLGVHAPRRETRQFVLRVRGHATEFPLQGEVVLFQGQTVAVTFPDVAPVVRCRDSLRAGDGPEHSGEHAIVVANVLPETSSPSARPVTPPLPVPVGDVTLRNPRAAELLHHDLTRPASIQPPSILSLLLTMRLARASGSVVVNSSRAVTLAFDRGALMSNDEDMAGLIAAVAHAVLPAVVSSGPAAVSPLAQRRDPLEVAAALIRAQTRVAPLEELELVMGHPRLGYLHRAKVAAGAPLPRLGPKEKRFLEVVVDGSRRVIDLPAVSGMPRHMTFQAILMMRCFGMVEFRPEGSSTAASPGDVIAQERRRLAAGSPFERVGAHWSDHPTQIRARYQQLQERFGPRSRNAQIAPAECAAITSMASEALNQLATLHGRRAIRAGMGGLDLGAAADVLMRHAELAAMRREGQAVLELLQTSVELRPNTENTTALKRLMAALEAARRDKAEVTFEMFGDDEPAVP